MTELKIHLPSEMEPYRADLEFFFATMVRKLYTNRHKGTSERLNPKDMLRGVGEERIEAQQALKLGQFDFGVECADIANFAFLAARGAWEMTREEFDKLEKNDG